jgi:release factor glutamine methyltransferase
MTGAEALREAVVRLRAAGVEAPARDARILLAHALGVDRGRLTLVLPEELPQKARARFEAAIAARTARQPVAQITGRRAFFGRDFKITPQVLDPRPETEALVRACLDLPFENLLDLGTGSGCILLSLLAERAGARGLGVDASQAALKVARENARALGLEGRARFALSDWFEAVEGRFGLIVSNPPYVSAAEMRALAPELRTWEPPEALTPGGDGLAAYRAIVPRAPAHLSPGGWLAVEIGARQGAEVSALFRQAGFEDVCTLPDLDGRDRVVTGRMPGNR